MITRTVNWKLCR